MTLAPFALPPVVRAFVNEDVAAVDPRFPALRRTLVEHGAAQCWHKHGTFLDHLVSVYRVLRIWGQPDAVCHVGMFHSAYSNEFVDLAIFRGQSDRGRLRELLGERAEELAYQFCIMPRRQLIEELRVLDELPETLTLSDLGVTMKLDRTAQRIFTVLTVADLADQWFEWQDEVWNGQFGLEGEIPDAPGVLLWPGRLRPSSGVLATLSRLARLIPGGDCPVPPVFDGCTRVISSDDVRRARDLYYDSFERSAKDPGAALRMLEEATRANPFVGEPHLLIAQLKLHAGEFDQGREAAIRGLRLLCDWGTAYDKRASWETWLSWGRVLLDCGTRRHWPKQRRGHNNFGLVRD